MLANRMAAFSPINIYKQIMRVWEREAEINHTADSSSFLPAPEMTFKNTYICTTINDTGLRNVVIK